MPEPETIYVVRRILNPWAGPSSSIVGAVRTEEVAEEIILESNRNDMTRKN